MSKNSETKTRVKLTKYWFRLIRCQTHLSLVAWLPAESSELGPTGESGLWDSAGPHQDRVKPNLQRLVGSNVSIMITSSMTTLIPLIMTIRSLNTVSNIGGQQPLFLSPFFYLHGPMSRSDGPAGSKYLCGWHLTYRINLD